MPFMGMPCMPAMAAGMGGMHSGGSHASSMESLPPAAGFVGGGMRTLGGAAEASGSALLSSHSGACMMNGTAGSQHIGFGDERRGSVMGAGTTVGGCGSVRATGMADTLGSAFMGIGNSGGRPPGSVGRLGNGSCAGTYSNSLPLGIAARHAMAKAAGKTLSTMDAGFSGYSSSSSKQATGCSAGGMGSGGSGITFNAGPLGHEKDPSRAQAATAGVDNDDPVLKIAKQRMQEHLQKQQLSETARAAETLRTSGSSNASSAITGENSRPLPLWPGHKECGG